MIRSREGVSVQHLVPNILLPVSALWFLLMFFVGLDNILYQTVSHNLRFCQKDEGDPFNTVYHLLYVNNVRHLCRWHVHLSDSTRRYGF